MANQRANQLALDKMNGDQRIAYYTGLFGQFATLTQSSNKTLFRIGKAAAYAQAIMSTYTAVSNGLATAPFFPVGIAMGALALAKGMANVQAINGLSAGQAHDGMTTVPTTGSYILQGGERVVQRDQNKDLTQFLDDTGNGNGNGGVTVGSINVAITVPDGTALLGMSRRDWEDIVSDKVVPALNALNGKGVRPDFVQRYNR
jgi:hypothetical protein